MRGKSLTDCLHGMFSACACMLYLSPKHMSTGTFKWFLTYLKATLSLTKASHSHLYLMHQSDRPSGCNHYPMVVPCRRPVWLQLWVTSLLQWTSWFQCMVFWNSIWPEAQPSSLQLAVCFSCQTKPNIFYVTENSLCKGTAVLKKQKQLLLTFQLTQLLWWKKAHFLSGVRSFGIVSNTSFRMTTSLYSFSSSTRGKFLF